MSARASTWLSPAACSGDMYVGVPTDIPVPVRLPPSDDVRRARRHDRARHAEVREHRVPLLEQDVLRLDVAMDDALAVRVGERVRDLDENPHRVAHGKLSRRLEPVAQRLAAHVRHHVPEQSVAGARRQNRHDVRMLQLRRDLDLLLEARRAHLARQLGRQHLDDDLPVQRSLRRDEQPAHPAAAQLTLEHVRVAERRLELCREEQVVHEGTSGGSSPKIMQSAEAS